MPSDNNKYEYINNKLKFQKSFREIEACPKHPDTEFNYVGSVSVRKHVISANRSHQRAIISSMDAK